MNFFASGARAEPLRFFPIKIDQPILHSGLFADGSYEETARRLLKSALTISLY